MNTSTVRSFSIYTPTRIFFGTDQVQAFAKASAQLGKRAFLVTGGGTVARLGYLSAVTDALEAAGVAVTHFSGIEPNPESETVNRATAALRETGADFVIGLGGGSVMDAAKAIAALASTDATDIWPYVIGEERAFGINTALPIAAIPTTAATASEVTPFSVISNRATHGKSILAGDHIKPSVAWLNPEWTVGVSRTTTQDGAADILSHVFEAYIHGQPGAEITDRYSEGVMATVLETLPILQKEPTNVQARANLFWASNLALNGYQNAGVGDYGAVMHYLEHALSGRVPDLAHGRGLATLYPAYFRWLLANGRSTGRFAQLGSRLFGLTGSEEQRAQGFIDRFEGWLKENELWQSLADLGFAEADLTAAAEYAIRTYGGGQPLDAQGPLTQSDIVEIFRATARQSSAATASR